MKPIKPINPLQPMKTVQPMQPMQSMQRIIPEAKHFHVVHLENHEHIHHFHGWKPAPQLFGPTAAEIFMAGALAFTAFCLFGWSLLCKLHLAGVAQ